MGATRTPESGEGTPRDVRWLQHEPTHANGGSNMDPLPWWAIGDHSVFHLVRSLRFL